MKYNQPKVMRKVQLDNHSNPYAITGDFVGKIVEIVMSIFKGEGANSIKRRTAINEDSNLDCARHLLLFHVERRGC